MKIITKSTAFVALIAIVSGCSKDKVSPASSGLNGRAKQINSGSVTISSISPGSGIIFTAVTITGSNFDTVKTNDTVKFNGVRALVNAATSTQIVATVPGSATTGKVTVTIGGATAASPNSFKVLHLVKIGSMLAYIPDPNSPGGRGPQLIKIVAGKNGILYGVATAGTNSHRIIKITNGKPAIIYTPPVNKDVTTLAVDSLGNVYTALDSVGVANGAAHIIKITPDGKSSIASPYAFDPVIDMVMDTRGNIYISTRWEQVAKMTPAGDVTTILRGDDPDNMAIDSYGNVYVVIDFGALFKIDTNGNQIIIYWNAPYSAGMACDKANNFLIADYGKINVTNAAGFTGSFPIYSSNPISISFDDTGHVYSLNSSTITEFVLQ